MSSENGISFEEDNPRKSVFELENTVNVYGRTIYVEEREEITGRPKIWYEINRQRDLIKRVRRTEGIFITNLGKTKYV